MVLLVNYTRWHNTMSIPFSLWVLEGFEEKTPIKLSVVATTHKHARGLMIVQLRNRGWLKENVAFKTEDPEGKVYETDNMRDLIRYGWLRRRPVNEVQLDCIYTR